MIAASHGQGIQQNRASLSNRALISLGGCRSGLAAAQKPQVCQSRERGQQHLGWCWSPKEFATFVAWGAHQKPGTAAKFPPGSKTLSVVQPLLCISKGDALNKLHILKEPGEKQGVTGLRLHWDHTQLQQISGSRHPLQLQSRLGGSPSFPQPWDLPCRAAREEAELWMSFLPEGTSLSIFQSHCLGSLAFKHCREKSLLARQ